MAKKKTTKKKTTKRGRPKGSRTKAVDIVDMTRTKCRKCGSTKRSRYLSKREWKVSGKHPDGWTFRGIIWRRCQCLDCGQWRDDREFLPE